VVERGRQGGSRVTFDDLAALAEQLPGVERSTSYGTRALKVRGKLLVRLKEDGETLVVRVSFVVRDHLLHTQPEIYSTTEHYRDYPSVLIYLPKVKPRQCFLLLEEAWRVYAAKSSVADYDLKRTQKK